MYPPGGPGRAWDRGGGAARRHRHQSASAVTVTYYFAAPHAGESTNRRVGGRFVGGASRAVGPGAEGRLPPGRPCRAAAARAGPRASSSAAPRGNGPRCVRPRVAPAPPRTRASCPGLCPRTERAPCPSGWAPRAAMSLRVTHSLTHRPPAPAAGQGESAKAG